MFVHLTISTLIYKKSSERVHWFKRTVNQFYSSAWECLLTSLHLLWFIRSHLLKSFIDLSRLLINFMVLRWDCLFSTHSLFHLSPLNIGFAYFWRCITLSLSLSLSLSLFTYLSIWVLLGFFRYNSFSLSPSLFEYGFCLLLKMHISLSTSPFLCLIFEMSSQGSKWEVCLKTILKLKPFKLFFKYCFLIFIF